MIMNKHIGLSIGVGLLMVLGLGAYVWLNMSNSPERNDIPVLASRPQDRAVNLPQPSPAAGPSQRPEFTPNNAPNGTSSQNSRNELSSASSASPTALGGSPKTSTASAQAFGVPIGKSGAPSMEGIQQRLQALVASGRQPTAREVDAVLADLQKNQGSNVVAGVNLQALRDNLARTDRISQIALEIQAIANQPGKSDLVRLQTLSAEMQSIQAALLTQVIASNPPPVR